MAPLFDNHSSVIHNSILGKPVLTAVLIDFAIIFHSAVLMISKTYAKNPNRNVHAPAWKFAFDTSFDRRSGKRLLAFADIFTILSVLHLFSNIRYFASLREKE